MEDISLSPPPSSASASDSEAYNTESARLYFGPLKTPERKFVHGSKGLFPPTQSTLPRRSPRLSSPRARSPSQPIDENEDIDVVAQLIIIDEEHLSDSATPQAGDGVEDEPSSVLANRVMHAQDNPSPPPSPTFPLSFFDPYHTTTPQTPTDYQNDLCSLSMNNRPQHHDDNPLSLSPVNYSKGQTSDSHSNLPFHVIQQELIPFDSIPALQPSQQAASAILLKESVLMNACLIPVDSPKIQQTFKIPPLVVEPPLKNVLVESVTAVDLAKTGEDFDIALQNSESQTSQLGVGHCSPQSSDVEIPVRRSPRPRISVAQNLVPPLAVFSLPPSGARTHIKKKLIIGTLDECIDDSQDSEETIQLSPTAPGTRQRSPRRSSMSFNRVLGSLSPKSTDLLSKLAFTSTKEPDNIPLVVTEPSSENQTPFTFSMFPTLPESATPQTPSRPTNPIRFSSPTRSASPHKIRLQAVVPNNLMNTPARRIPIEQGIAQGHVSPQKAAQLGFKPDGTPLTFTHTPARRVLISEHSTNPATKPGGIRFGTPSKGKERERSAEPSSRPFVARRNEREKKPGPPSAATLAKSSTRQTERLPFPLGFSNPASSMTSSTVPEHCQGNPPQEQPSNAKSYLRQPTSRIPRIGIKPYTRPPALKSTEKDSTTLYERTADPKSQEKSTTTESNSISSSTSRSTTSSISGVKPTLPSLTSLLKRKREVEKPPVKPRIIPLRPVPKVVLSPSASSKIRFGPPTGLNAKKTSQNSAIRPSRGVDSESSKVSRHQEPEAPIVVASNPRLTETVMKSPQTKESSSPLPPGSPMMEVRLSLLQDVLEPQSKPEPIIPDKTLTSDASSLRRITRSRRTAVTEGSSRPLPARRKPASRRMDDVFSGMSITALKDLTTSNTAHNQQYLIANLETEIVRREGVRPESPAVKIRTIVQRQTEDRLKERAERAIRRARRSDGDITSSDIEGSSDVGYSSPCEDHFAEGSHRPFTEHRRGPGDEEDYETPERLDRHKKTKLFVEADNEDAKPERRVKWDRGLFTSVYLDEVKLGTRQPLKENRSLKGILAPTAKALRLDTLGNLPQADLPLTDLVQENITIKKIVYDNDVESVPELIVVKNTRSKGKKIRS